jgi:hypothetical protein
MKVVSSLAWLSAVSTLGSTLAFSVNPTASSAAAKHQTSLTSKLSHSAQRTASSALNMVASPVEKTVDVSNMERGVGGRIEEAFAQSKERGEAAFVTFVTAGYPTAQGTCYLKQKEMEQLIAFKVACLTCSAPSHHD